MKMAVDWNIINHGFANRHRPICVEIYPVDSALKDVFNEGSWIEEQITEFPALMIP